MDGNPDASEPTDLACTLGPGGVTERLAEWQSTLAAARSTETIDHGRRFRFAREVQVAELARLAAAEQDCCRFFTFRLTIETGGVTLEVTAPDEAQPAIDALIGSTT